MLDGTFNNSLTDYYIHKKLKGECISFLSFTFKTDFLPPVDQHLIAAYQFDIS